MGIPRILVINDIAGMEEELKRTGVKAAGIEIMAPKGILRIVKLEEIGVPAANLLKQDFLSIGGEAAVSRWALDYSRKTTNVLLIGTLYQFGRLLDKMKLQPFGLKALSLKIKETLEDFDRKFNVLGCGSFKLPLGKRTLIMGIINMTPDSFSGDGIGTDLKSALKQAEKFVEDGADIIDIGGESTRPGSLPVGKQEEAKRVIPVIRALAKKIKVPISVDTYKADVAERAVDAGAGMINDIWGLRADSRMAKTAAKAGVPVIIMHNKKDQKYTDLVSEVINFLKESIDKALDAGVKEENIIIDPGIGFGKNPVQNIYLLRHLSELKSLGKPILIGTSRKSHIGYVLGLPVEERLEGTAATVAWSIMKGADIVRVHDVKEMTRVARMIDAVKGAA